MERYNILIFFDTEILEEPKSSTNIYRIKITKVFINTSGISRYKEGAIIAFDKRWFFESLRDIIKSIFNK